MPEIKPPKTIHQIFMELPERVRDWLTSERVTYTIIEINKKLDLFGSLLTVIPNLITKLVTKNLDPKNFTKELEDGLGIDNEQAQGISREIVEKILRPIDLPLKETGVFVGLIYGATSATPVAPLNSPQRNENRPIETGRPTPPQIPQRPAAPIPPAVPSSPALTRQSEPALIQTKEAAHPLEEKKAPEPPSSIQSKVIPIPIKRPQPPLNS